MARPTQPPPPSARRRSPRAPQPPSHHAPLPLPLSTPVPSLPLSSFQADDLADVQARLAAAAIPAAREAVTEAGLVVTQLFFHDPDRNMIEVCDCHALPTVALDGTVIQGAAACAMRASSAMSSLVVKRT